MFAVYPSYVTFTLMTSGEIISGDIVNVRCVTANFHLDAVFNEMRWKIGNRHDDNSLSMEDDTGFTLTDASNGEQSVTGTFSFIAEPEHNGKYVTCVPRWSSGVDEDLKRSQQITVNCKKTWYYL